MLTTVPPASRNGGYGVIVGVTGVAVSVGGAGVGLSVGVGVGVAVTTWVTIIGVSDFCACAVAVRAFAPGMGVTRWHDAAIRSRDTSRNIEKILRMTTKNRLHYCG